MLNCPLVRRFRRLSVSHMLLESQWGKPEVKERQVLDPISTKRERKVNEEFEKQLKGDIAENRRILAQEELSRKNKKKKE